jgi:predicted nucleic acid-binding protein
LTPIVVDSAVALKWFVPEVLSDQAAELLDGSHELLAPDLLFAEFGNILWKKIGRRELKVKEAREILAALERVPLVITPAAELLAPALEIAVTHSRTVYDALYVALAAARRCTLITADERLVRAFAAGPLSTRVCALSG